MQVAPKPGEAWVATVGQLYLQQVHQFGTGLEFYRHIVVKNPYPALGFDPPQAFKLRRQFTRIKGLLRGQALLLTGHVVLAHLAEVPLEQIAINQRIAVVERQG
ncbi:hypothetical protein PS685_05332 [Pseudomonas fluorescens]|uniref:Uncharacterized protein n=1 Tax=Pseudomonas fluorescens TaxID=294 RepID=A0A5E7AE88_PSEFL|nr:hypothetical protein PS685_05332 [Pseudomonas fluorescens]